MYYEGYLYKMRCMCCYLSKSDLRFKGAHCGFILASFLGTWICFLTNHFWLPMEPTIGVSF